ncbi:hypothetical protein SANA_27680 [Gottschalkiaceae bacterium SANA]|nr:hypothetical protein SANA_27680 [Gottschalkiaceae bacterium SANA]
MNKSKNYIPIKMGENKQKDEQMDYSREYRIAVSLFCFFALLYFGVLILAVQYTPSVLYDLGKWAYPALATIWFLGFLLLRDPWFNRVIFRWKKPYMKEYYRVVGKKIKKLRKNDWSLEEEVVFVPNSPNGKMLGILESMIYMGAFFSRNLFLIGIVVGIRSYLTTHLHPNKEESEFYLMGVLGSLIYAMAGAFLFAWLSAYWFDLSWFSWIKWM